MWCFSPYRSLARYSQVGNVHGNGHRTSESGSCIFRCALNPDLYLCRNCIQGMNTMWQLSGTWLARVVPSNCFYKSSVCSNCTQNIFFHVSTNLSSMLYFAVELGWAQDTAKVSSSSGCMTMLQVLFQIPFETGSVVTAVKRASARLQKLKLGLMHSHMQI